MSCFIILLLDTIDIICLYILYKSQTLCCSFRAQSIATILHTFPHNNVTIETTVAWFLRTLTPPYNSCPWGTLLARYETLNHTASRTHWHSQPYYSCMNMILLPTAEPRKRASQSLASSITCTTTTASYYLALHATAVHTTTKLLHHQWWSPGFFEFHSRYIHE